MIGGYARTLFVDSSGLENAKKLVSRYKLGEIKSMTPELWQAKKVVDSTLHPGRYSRTEVWSHWGFRYSPC